MKLATAPFFPLDETHFSPSKHRGAVWLSAEGIRGEEKRYDEPAERGRGQLGLAVNRASEFGGPGS